LLFLRFFVGLAHTKNLLLPGDRERIVRELFTETTRSLWLAAFSGRNDAEASPEGITLEYDPTISRARFVRRPGGIPVKESNELRDQLHAKELADIRIARRQQRRNAR